MSNIIAKAGGQVNVLVIGPHTVFGAWHAAQGYGEVSLSKDGKPYIPPGTPEWVRYKHLKTGVEVEENGSNFAFYEKSEQSGDRFFGSTHRPIPKESWEPHAVVKVGDKVMVDSQHWKMQVAAKVVAADKGTGFIVISYPALGGGEPDGKPADSGSRVNNAAGVLVGFVSTKDAAGSKVVVPALDILAGTTPAPIQTPPPPVPGTGPTPIPPVPPVPGPTPGLSEDYKKGYLAGRAHTLDQFKSILNSLG